MNNVAIDLSPTRCNVVEIAVPRDQKPDQRGTNSDTRVRTFASIPHRVSDPAALAHELRRLREHESVPRQAWVALWGLRAVHRFLLLSPRPPREMEAIARREVLRDLETLQIEPDDAAIGISIGSTVDAPSGLKHEVTAVGTSVSDIRARIRPIVEAGFIVEGVSTPAVALCSLSRLSRTPLPGMPSAYVSITADATSLAIVRDGRLLLGRELRWGYRGQRAIDRGRTLERDDLAAKLGSELRRTLMLFKETTRIGVEQILVCGDLPELRSVTAPLIEVLDLEIETLDSMEGIDAGALPDPVERFQEQLPALRLAWALASDPNRPANLLSAPVRGWPGGRLRRRLLAGTTAAALIVSGLVYAYADRFARTEERMLQPSQQRVAELETELARVQRLRTEAARDVVRRSMLIGMDLQGPRLARILEALAQRTPNEVTLRTLKLSAQGAVWRAELTGVAVAANGEQVDTAMATFLQALRASPYIRSPLRSSSVKAMAGEAAGGAAPGRGARAGGPAGTSDIEFTVGFDIPK